MKCSPNRDSLSPAGSVRVGYGLPPAAARRETPFESLSFGSRIGIRSRLRARSGSATGVRRTVIHYRPPCGARNFLLAAALEISTAARFTPCLLPLPAAAGRETPFKSKQKSTSAKCSPNRDSLSPAGSVRVGSDSPPDCHSLPTRSNPSHIKREKHFYEVLLSFGSRIGIRTPTYRVRVCCATVTQFGCICF